MHFQIPAYHAPDFSRPEIRQAPCVTFLSAPADGVAPDNYHATSVFPEYFHLQSGEWVLLQESRMDAVVRIDSGNLLSVVELRHLAAGDQVACGRRENGEDGILVHTQAFDFPIHIMEKFAFRSHLTRETSFSIDYDELYQLMDYEKTNGFMVWVLGPAVVFDRDARNAFVALIERGYVHALLAGNALATHDVEGAIFGTALGQEIYTKQTTPLGHYRHLDAINRIRTAGSITQAVQSGIVRNGIMHAVIRKNIPFVLAGSIRDDGPLPETRMDLIVAQEEYARELAGADLATFAALGIRSVYDLRTGAERTAQPDRLPMGTEYIVLDVLKDSADAVPAQLRHAPGRGPHHPQGHAAPEQHRRHQSEQPGRQA